MASNGRAGSIPAPSTIEGGKSKNLDEGMAATG